MRYEGGVLSNEIERLNARYVAGEIDSAKLTAAILASDTVRSQHATYCHHRAVLPSMDPHAGQHVPTPGVGTFALPKMLSPGATTNSPKNSSA